jgi:hypothetical protein
VPDAAANQRTNRRTDDGAHARCRCSNRHSATYRNGDGTTNDCTDKYTTADGHPDRRRNSDARAHRHTDNNADTRYAHSVRELG